MITGKPLQDYGLYMPLNTKLDEIPSTKQLLDMV